MSTTSSGTPFEVRVSSGRLAARRWGSPGAPLLVCVPGLSQDARSFERLGARLGSAARQVVAVSPRGRGGSDRTAPGSYGWPAHAADVLELAGKLGAPAFDIAGWSFGGFVAMQLAQIARDRVRRLVLIDVAGVPEAAALGPIASGVERLGAVYTSPAEYVERAGAGGVLDGCAAAWRDYLEGDLVPVDGGFTTRTNRDAVLEDLAHGSGRDPVELWPALTMPVLLVRAARPVLPGLGHVVGAEVRDRFLSQVPGARVVEVDANHYCVAGAEASAEAIASFLEAPAAVDVTSS